jgi:Flp pilus assembly protein TadD
MPRPLRSAATLVLASCLWLSPMQTRAQEGIAGAFLAAKVAASNADYMAADSWYQRALALAPDNAQIVQGAMISALSLGDLPRAAGLAQQLAALGVKDQTADLARLAAAAQSADFAGVLDLLAQGVSTGTLQDDLLAGWAHIGLGQMNDGLARLDQAAQTPGLAGFGLYHRAIALALAGDYDGAAVAMTAPETAALRNARRGAIFLAEVLSQTGKSAEAADMLRLGLGTDDNPQMQDMITRLDAGEALAISGFKDATSGLAEAFFSIASALGDETDPAYILLQTRIAAVLRPDDTEALVLTAATLEKLGQFDLAAQSYSKVLPDSPDFPLAEIGRAEALYSADRKEESLQILRDLATARPADIDVQIALGNGLRRDQFHDQAIMVYTAALGLVPQIGPQHWPLLYSRAISLEATGDFPRAEADFRAALELNPNQPSVLNYLGYSLVDRGLKLEEALGMIQRAVAASPNSGYIVDSLAWAYFRLGRFAEALAPMERAALLEPIDPIVTDHLGDVYWANGRKREAMFQWRRALSYQPTEKDAARIRLKLELGLDAVRAREGDPPFPLVAGQGGL